MNCLVTGCAGFIGSHLAESLLDDGIHVVGVDCFNPNYARPQKLENLARLEAWDQFEFASVDLADGDLRDLLAGVGIVYHLAAEPGVRTSWGRQFESYVRNNVLATQQLLDAMRAAPGCRLVYASSSSVYGDAAALPTTEDASPHPVSPYGVTKLSGEHLCHAYGTSYGIDWVALRYFSVYGPRQRPDMAFHRFCRSALAGDPIHVYGDGSQTRDFTYVEDVVAATRLAASGNGVEGGIYNVGGGSQVSINDVLATIGDIAEGHLEVHYHPPTSGDVRATQADISLARAELSYDPLVTVESGLRYEFEWLADLAVRD